MSRPLESVPLWRILTRGPALILVALLPDVREHVMQQRLKYCGNAKSK